MLIVLITLILLMILIPASAYLVRKNFAELMENSQVKIRKYLRIFGLISTGILSALIFLILYGFGSEGYMESEMPIAERIEIFVVSCTPLYLFGIYQLSDFTIRKFQKGNQQRINDAKTNR